MKLNWFGRQRPVSSTSAHRQNVGFPVVTDLDGKDIPESEIEQLRLRLDILGVCYERIDERPGVQVLFEVTFVLPPGRHLSYARLPFQGLPFEDTVPSIRVQALTPEGKELEYLGKYDDITVNSRMPHLSAGAAGLTFGLDGLGTKEEIMQKIPHSISLIGYKAVMNENAKSHWEFHNELPNGKQFRHYYPTHIRLIAVFASPHDSTDATFPFYLRFGSDCQVTFTDRIMSKVRHAIGKPRQYQSHIRGPYHEDTVREHIRERKCGLSAAMKRMNEWAQPSEFVNRHWDLAQLNLETASR